MIEKRDWGKVDERARRMWAFHQEIETVAPFIASLKGCMALRGWCRSVTGQPMRAVDPGQTTRLEEMMTRAYPRWKETP